MYYIDFFGVKCISGYVICEFYFNLLKEYRCGLIFLFYGGECMI